MMTTTLPATHTIATRHAVFEVADYGSMAGAHGQPGALHWAVATDGAVLFHDRGRMIFGVCDELASALGDGAAVVRRCYLQSYAYAHDHRASFLGFSEPKAVLL